MITRVNIKFTYFFLLSTAVLICYFNIFVNEFVFDDTGFISGNVLEHKSLANIPKFFNSPTGELYRPLRSIAYALTHLIWATKTFGYHLNSILFHIACTVLLYLIVKILIKEETVALFAALFFATHPIHTESVTFMTASFDLLGPVFFLLAIYLYLQSIDNIKQRFFYFASIISFTIAAFSSEMSLTLPFVLILVEWYLSRKFSLKNYIPFFLIAVFYIFVRFVVLGITGRSTGEHYLAYNRLWTLLTMAKVFVYYVYLLFIPKLYSQPDYEDYFKMSVSLSDPGVISPLLFLILLLIIAIVIRKNSRIISFSIFWFFITLLPVSNIIPMKNIMAERHLYIPSIAACILLPVTLVKIFYAKKIFYFSAIILLLVYGTFAIKRNTDWKDRITLWTRTLINFPQSGKAYTGLGVAYAEKKQFDKAIYYFSELKKLDPDDIENLYNLGTAYLDNGKYELAIDTFKEILIFNPEETGALVRIGMIYNKINNYDMAIKFFKQVLEQNPNYAEMYERIGIIYFNKGQFNQAIEELKKSIEIKPS
ncbi:MAG: tetratricopeptide repeat protein, partial [Elusimicrobiota bacterium]